MYACIYLSAWVIYSLCLKVDLKAFQSPDLAVREACVKVAHHHKL